MAVTVVAMVAAVGCTDSQEGTFGDSVSEIRGVLDEQVAAWNRGDIPAFMAGYAETDTLRFASGDTVYRGWQQTLARYRASYVDDIHMGTLTFSDLDIWPLSIGHAVVFGRWSLSRSEDVGDAGGLFTLIFERMPDGWKIVHDHTSSAPANPASSSQQEATAEPTS